MQTFTDPKHLSVHRDSKSSNIASSEKKYFNNIKLPTLNTQGKPSINMQKNLVKSAYFYLEIFKFKTSITFVQAGFPLITLCMIYSSAAPMFARLLYNELFWNGEKDDQRKDRDRLLIVILGILLIAPPIVMIETINVMNESEANLDKEIFELEMLPSHDSDFRQYYLEIASTLLVAVACASYYTIKKAFKTNKRVLPEYQRDEEDPFVDYY